MADAIPLIDRSLFFGDADVSSAKLSPDGAFIAFAKPWNKMRNVWVKRTSEPMEAAKRLTADSKRSVDAFLWSRDSRYILLFQDSGGNENFGLYAVDPRDARRRGRRSFGPRPDAVEGHLCHPLCAAERHAAGRLCRAERSRQGLA